MIRSGEQPISQWRIFWILAVLILVVWLIWRLSDILLPFALAALVAYIANPVVDRMEKFGWSRGFSVLVLALILLAILALVGILIIPQLVAEINDLINNYEPLVEKAQASYHTWLESIQGRFSWLQERTNLAEQIEIKAGEYVQWIVSKIPAFLASVAQGIIGFVGLFLITIVLSFWMLKDYHQIGQRMLTFLPVEYTERITALGGQVNRLVSSYLLGILLLSAVCGGIAIGILFAFGMPLSLIHI